MYIVLHRKQHITYFRLFNNLHNTSVSWVASHVRAVVETVIFLSLWKINVGIN
jgi:hypothetical protein